MQKERGRIKGGCQIESNNLYDGITYKSNELKIITSSLSTSSPSSSFSSSSSSPSNSFNYIRHEVRKMDTLAGIAIKYGVEIADVRRLNGLATDLQMFAHKTLRIPFQGRHPTIYQEISRDATEAHAEHRREIIDGLESLKLKPPPPQHQKTCLAIGPLHGHYGLPPIVKRKDAKHKPSKSLCLGNEDLLLIDKPALKQHRRSRSLLTGDMTDENGNSKRLNRQWQRDNASPEGSSSTGTVPTIASLLVDKLLTFRKSTSTSNLQDFDIASSYSLFVANKWNLLPETFALPSFDGSRNPIASWRNKSSQD